MNAKNLTNFLVEVGNLKTLKRKGWVIHGLKNSESVADHSFRTAVMASLLAKKFRLNREKAVIMSLIHDLAESQIGDIASRPIKSSSKKKKMTIEKHLKEKRAFLKLSAILGDKEFYKIWLEFEKGKSKESRFVRQLDKLEMHLQAMEYEKDQNKNLDEFFSLVDEEIKDKKLKEILKEIMRNRKRTTF